MAQKGSNTNRQHTDRIGRSLYVMYVLFLLVALVLIGRIIYIQAIWTPDPEIAGMLTPSSKNNTIEPIRGSILSRDGRILAMSLPIYDVYMDCSVRKAEFKEIGEKDPARRDSLESVWLTKAVELSKGLSRILGDRSADEYYNMIAEGRRNDRKYVRIATGIERADYTKICALPLFEEGSNKGGIITEKQNIRKYPYGTLARRTIGFVRNNKSTVANTHVGIEGKYDFILHGVDGKISLHKVDNGKWVQNYDSTYVKPEDGKDIRTTIDIDLQDIVESALREQVDEAMDIEGACAVLMEVESGAVRAMSNLWRDSLTHRMEESRNLAIGRTGEPGSVFKTSTLMTVLEDKKIKSLDDSIPTNHGHITGFPDDPHIRDYEWQHKTKYIPVIEGFKMSSNYVFRYLAIQNYGKRPKTFLDRIYMYKLGEAFDFDLDLSTPTVPNPDSEGWSSTDLGSVAIGYSITETPLHILTFYNGIANKGKLMKPYLIESIEENGMIKEQRGPSVLNASICSKATADTLTRALSAVTEDGTAKRLKGAKCTVAGKTGTSRVVLDYAPDNQNPYLDHYGRFKNQGTFVGFFPAEEPKYSIIVTVYSTLGHASAYGGTLPAAAVRTIVDQMYAIDPCWGGSLSKTGQVPVMKAGNMEKTKAGVVPAVTGMGLSDAICTIENAGFKCQFSGVGHVSSQSPKAGISTAKGSTVTIRLK